MAGIVQPIVTFTVARDPKTGQITVECAGNYFVPNKLITRLNSMTADVNKVIKEDNGDLILALETEMHKQKR